VLMAVTSDEGIVESTEKKSHAHADALSMVLVIFWKADSNSSFLPRCRNSTPLPPQLPWIEKRLYCASEFVFQRDVDKHAGPHLSKWSQISTSHHNSQPMLSWEIERVDGNIVRFC
jgi:hypothetical protein